MPVSSYVSASGMELWPLYNSSISTSQRISLELTEFCTHCSASEGYELCEDSCHRKSRALNITQTAYMQHVPTSIPTPFSSDSIQTAFIDSIYTELKSIRTPLQNISQKKRQASATNLIFTTNEQIKHTQEFLWNLKLTHLWQWQPSQLHRLLWRIGISAVLNGCHPEHEMNRKRIFCFHEWRPPMSVVHCNICFLSAKAKNAHVATNHSNVYQT